MNSKLKDLNVEFLFQAVLSLKTMEDCYNFFDDLCTVSELKALSQRLQVAKLLLAGETYEKIRSQVSVSSSTITRISTELQYGSGGYRAVLNRLEAGEDAADSSSEGK